MANLNWNRSKNISAISDSIRKGYTNPLMQGAGSKKKIVKSNIKRFNQPVLIFTPKLVNRLHKEEPTKRYARPWV